MVNLVTVKYESDTGNFHFRRVTKVRLRKDYPININIDKLKASYEYNLSVRKTDKTVRS